MNDLAKQHGLLLQSALELASLGLKVLPVHNVDERGWCSCGCRKLKCGSRGKHPRIFNWQLEASSDEDVIAGWWEKWPLANIGIQWGPRSGAIDVEFDSEEGRQAADKYLGGVVTPSYQSRRSVHRIFRFVDALAGFGATRKGQAVEHLEYRIGADQKGAQSVAPPSRHYSGCQYTWLQGLNILDVEIAPPPAALVELILRPRKLLNGGTSGKKASPLTARIPHGERYLALVSLAGTMRRRGLVAEEIVPSLRAVAERRCEHVAGDEIDVETIAANVCRYEPGNSILRNAGSLAQATRDRQADHLSPAIQRARKHAIDHRLKQGRLGR